MCINPVTEMEDGCYPTSSPGQYFIRLGHAELFGSKKKLLEHRFITYRGYTYDDLQILDINDPNYKYINGQNLNSGGIETIGRSYCSQNSAVYFATEWANEEYNVLTTNCQHFASAMDDYLRNGPCNVPMQGRKKRQDNENELDIYLARLLTNCSVVCCPDTMDSASVLYTLPASSVLVFLGLALVTM
jgi:hypothetical protein